MRPYTQASTLIVAAMLMAAGNGLLSTIIPVQLHATGIGSTMVGVVITAYAVGMLLGCLYSGRAVRRVGHIRAFAAFLSVNAVCALLLGSGEWPLLWMVLRAMAGFAVTAVFIVSQSWLNEVTDSEHRGRVMSLFYVGYTVAIGAGAWLSGHIDVASGAAFAVPAGLYAIATATIALTRIEAPLPPERVQVDFGAVWRVSPVGLVGVFVSGALGMTFQATGPAWGSAIGLPAATIGLLIMCTQLGNLTIQWPLGWLSDHVDRRNVLIAATALVLVASVSLAGMDVGHLLPLLLLFGLFGGAAETLYSVSAAQANDHASGDDYVTVSSTLLVSWSVGATVGPMAGTLAMSLVGPSGLLWYFVLVATVFGGFALARRFARAPASIEQREDFVALASAPLSADWNAHAVEESRAR